MKSLPEYALIDIHYHTNPDLYHRRCNPFAAGEQYQKLNAAVVLKSHLGATSIQATLAQKAGLPVLPSVVLNHLNGGIDYRVIMRALSEYQPIIGGKMIVDFPTITGRAIKSRLKRNIVHPYLNDHCFIGETVFDDNQKLHKRAIDILKMANDYPIVLTTGHASKEEVYSLIDACLTYQVNALLLNQPANPQTGLNAKELKELLQHPFVWVEQTALTYLIGHQSKDDFIEVLTELPRVIYSSDLGQTSQMDIWQWFEFTKTFFASLELTELKTRELLQTNAANLLSLSSST